MRTRSLFDELVAVTRAKAQGEVPAPCPVQQGSAQQTLGAFASAPDPPSLSLPGGQGRGERAALLRRALTDPLTLRPPAANLAQHVTIPQVSPLFGTGTKPEAALCSRPGALQQRSASHGGPHASSPGSSDPDLPARPQRGGQHLPPAVPHPPPTRGSHAFPRGGVAAPGTRRPHGPRGRTTSTRSSAGEALGGDRPRGRGNPRPGSTGSGRGWEQQEEGQSRPLRCAALPSAPPPQRAHQPSVQLGLALASARREPGVLGIAQTLGGGHRSFHDGGEGATGRAEGQTASSGGLRQSSLRGRGQHRRVARPTRPAPSLEPAAGAAAPEAAPAA